MVIYIDGIVQAVTSTNDREIATAEANDLLIGTNSGGNHLSGVIDEFRLYEVGLSSNDVMSIFLDGTMMFTTSATAQPPVVELSKIVAEANASVTVIGELVSKDLTNPVVRVYYGLEDGGFNPIDWNNSFVLVDGGSPVQLGEFNATISGLVPGSRYYFRAFAESVDGQDWSTGDPEVRSDLLGYWRMDEMNGTEIHDSLMPFHPALLEGVESNFTRSKGYRGHSLYVDGYTNRVNLDANNTDYLEQSFDGRTVSIMLKPDVSFYTGPKVVGDDSLAAYYTFDNQTGNSVVDLSVNDSKANFVNGSTLQSGKYNQALYLDGSNDQVVIPSSGTMSSLNQSSYTISMWVMPNFTNTGTYTEGRLHAHGFLRNIDNTYYTNIETMLGLTPSGSNYLTEGPGGRGLDFNNDSDYRNAGIGINRNNNYLSLFNGVFFAPTSGTYGWEIRGNDDRGTIWLDLDRDGVFETNGDAGNEQLLYQPQCCGTQSTSIFLATGYYRIAIAHGEGGGGSNQEAYFSTPGGSGGPTVLTKIKPTDYPTLFMTENEKNLMSRGPISFSFDGNNHLVYSHADQSGSVSVSSNSALNTGNWSHLAVSADFDSGKLAIYMDGELKQEALLPNGAPLELASSLSWIVGGNKVTWGDFFGGQIDDLRFYTKSLSGTEVMEIFSDDVSGAIPAAKKSQIIYDEGTSTTGLTIAIDDDGLVRARISENGSMSSLVSDVSIRDDQWHHLVVTFGDSPKSFKMYLDGLLNGDPSIHSSGVISLHLEDPSLGAVNGSSLFPGYGNYRGFFDELRIYDRGIDEFEVTQVFDGDSENEGFLDFLAIEKPSIITLSAVDVMPTEATMRVEVQSIGGDIEYIDSSADFTFRQDTFEILQAWYSSYSLANDFSNGEIIESWTDQSGSGKDLNNFSGDPRVLLSGLKGKPVINFDGNDLLWSTHDFDHLTDTGYTIVSLARYTGSANNRVISSRTRNFLFGYHGSLTGRWYAEGWISTLGPLDSDWHLHIGKIEAKAGDPQASFRRDGELLVAGSRGSNNTIFGPGILQLGGWMSNREMSACEVAEVMIYDRELNEIELSQLEGYIAHKWQMNNELLPSSHPYFSIDPFGGSSSFVKTVAVGGDRPVVKIFWGDDNIESNSTEIDYTDNTKWDHVFEINASNPVGLGNYFATVDGLDLDKQYYFRGYAENLGGGAWAPNTETFIAMDTTFTKYTMDGMVLWLDAQDVDGDGATDSYQEGVSLPIWIDKSLSEKHAKQSVATKTPIYSTDGFSGLPAVRFQSGDAYNVGSLATNYGNVHVFMVSKGSGVGIGATDGVTGWTLDAKTGNSFSAIKSESNTLQQVAIGFDPQTGYGMLIGEIAEIIVFDRALPKAEQEMIEGYLAHKWGVVDDLAETGFKITKGLRLYYPFNETDGSVAQDYSTEMRHAEVMDADLKVDGKFGSGIDFENIDPYWARLDLLQNELSLNTGSWTVSTWFEAPITSLGSDFFHAPFYGDAASGFAFIENVTDWNTGLSVPGRLGLDTGAVAKYTGFSADTISAGWHHLVVRSSVGQSQFYLDSTLVGTVSDHINLEVSSVGNGNVGGFKFSPKMDDFRVYGRTLSVNEIISLYGNGDGDFGVHPYYDFPPTFDNIPVIIPPKNPIVYWTFNELAGTEVRDDSGKENHGVFDDNLTASPNLFDYSEIGRNGTALKFDGNQTVTLFNDSGNFDIRGPFSLCFWLKTSDLDAEIMSSGQFSILMSDGFIRGFATIGSQQRYTEPFPVPADQWIHLILTWDGNKLFLLKNNEEVVAPVNASGNLTGDPSLYIGGREFSSDGPFEGVIDDLRIYDQYLTASQRNEVFNFDDPPLIAYFGEDFSYQIETIKGPTEFLVFGLPEGLQVDPQNGLIFGEANETGDFTLNVIASNFSGSDTKTFNDPMLTVLKGRQSINLSNQSELLIYGDPPLDLNLTATSGLPVSLELMEGNQSVDLNGSQLIIKHPGYVKIRAFQDGNSNWLSAQSMLLEYQILPKELVIRVDDQFRRPDELNPDFTYELIGLAENDSPLDINVSITTPVSDGNISNPTPIGVYEIVPSAQLSSKYFYSLQNGTLTISEKLEQEIIFDQNLSDIPATLDYLDLTAISTGMDGNPTNLPVNYIVEDEAVARILVTEEDSLIGYWKFNEQMYNGAKDEMGNYNGTLFGLDSTSPSKVWRTAYFGNGVEVGTPAGRVDFGAVEFDSNFSLSLWLKPNDVDSNHSQILVKGGISGMNLLRLAKSEQNSSLEVYLSLDGINENLVLTTQDNFLVNDEWINVCLVYNGATGTVSLYVDGEILLSEGGQTFSGTDIKSRYSSFILGGSQAPIKGLVDDLRLYGKSLSADEVSRIYGEGGGDFDRITLVGAGQTRIVANQRGSEDYEVALPVDNYLTVIRVPQNLTFSAIPNLSVGDFPYKLDATASSGLPVSFYSSDPSLATIVGEYAYIRGAGDVTITAVQDGDNRYETAPSVEQSFTINWGNLFSDSTPGLRLWFDATDVNGDGQPDSEKDFISGNKVSLWADKSGNTNNPIQANITKMPQWTPASLNQKATLQFDSNLSQIFEIQNQVNSPNFIFLVHRYEDPNDGKILGGDLKTTNSDGFITLEHASGNVEIVSEVNSRSWSVTSLRVAPNSQTLWVNGQVVGAKAYAQGVSAIDFVGENFTGEIAEALVFDQEVNSINREKIEGYLAHKWGMRVVTFPIYIVIRRSLPSFGGDQEIVWGGLIPYFDANGEIAYKLPDRADGDAPFELIAYATSGLPVSFVSSNQAVVTIVGNKVYINGPGEVTISAIQMGDTRYHPAIPQPQVLTVINPVDKDVQVISFEDIPLKVRDDPPFELNASASSGLPIEFKVDYGPAFVDPYGVVILEGVVGTISITAAQGGSAYFHPALPVTKTFVVSSKQRPKILFPDSAEDGVLHPLPFGHRPIILQGIRSTSSDFPYQITSSDESIAKIYQGNKIIALDEGNVTLSFDVPASLFYVAAETQTKILPVVRPTKSAWLEYRKNDVRYERIKDRFSARILTKSPESTNDEARQVFDEDYSDSDGDGYSNLFERAMGLDSLGADNPQFMPIKLPDTTDGKQRISFIRYKTPLQTTGEDFRYVVEKSTNLRTWSRFGVLHDASKDIDLGGSMERVTFTTEDPLRDGGKNFLRIRVYKP